MDGLLETVKGSEEEEEATNLEVPEAVLRNLQLDNGWVGLGYLSQLRVSGAPLLPQWAWPELREVQHHKDIRHQSACAAWARGVQTD